MRNGDALPASDVVIGLPIQNYDMMKTGDDGNAQVKIASGRAPASTIAVSPDTQFTFELSTLDGRQRFPQHESIRPGRLAGPRRADGEHRAQRLEFARLNAPQLIRLNVSRCQQLLDGFDRDCDQLMRQRSIITEWSAEDQGGTIGAAGST